MIIEAMIVYKLLILDRNTWNHITVCKKTLKKQLHKKGSYKSIMYMIPWSLGIK